MCDSGCERELLQCGSGKYHKKMSLPCCKSALHWLILYLHSICIINHSLFIQFVAFAAAVSSRMHSAVLAKRKIKAYACVCASVWQCVRCADFSLPAWKYAMNRSALIIETRFGALSTPSPARRFPLSLCCCCYYCWKIDATSASGKFIRPAQMSVKNNNSSTSSNSNVLHIKLHFNVFKMYFVLYSLCWGSTKEFYDSNI